jgi:hypothetical protein
MTAMKKGSTQDELNKAFALKTEIFHPKPSGSKSQKSWRSRQQDGNEDVKMTEKMDNNDDTDEGDSKPPPCKRTHLASSQHVITERNCCCILHCVSAYLSCADPGQSTVFFYFRQCLWPVLKYKGLDGSQVDWSSCSYDRCFCRGEASVRNSQSLSAQPNFEMKWKCLFCHCKWSTIWCTSWIPFVYSSNFSWSTKWNWWLYTLWTRLL